MYVYAVVPALKQETKYNCFPSANEELNDT